MIWFAIVLFVIFVLVSIGDCWSTAFGFKYNHKFTFDKKFRQKVQRQLHKELKKDQSKAEMNSLPRKLIKKYGADRACLYILIFGYFPLSILLLYSLKVDFDYSFPFTIGIVAFMIGVLYRQIMRMAILKNRFGLDLKEEVSN